ncbi:arsenate reductase/protein-tyrosine-phosphatase family protein, partial [Marisediminicola senii]
MRVLVVCTANVCRSPFAAALLANRLVAADPGTTITVSSAGSRAHHGAAACEVAAAMATDGGFPILGHASRPLDVSTIEGADLILTAEAAHRSAVSRLVPGARARTFTISEA